MASGTNNPNPQNIMTCYIHNMTTGTTITFPAYPEDLSEGYATTFNSTDVMGRSAPYLAYANNAARTVSYSVVLHDDICDNMMSVVEQIKSLVYPIYHGSIVQPPYCRVKFGQMVSMYAVVDSVDFSWSDTVIEDNQHFSKVEVSFSFTELRIQSLPTARGTFNEV